MTTRLIKCSYIHECSTLDEHPAKCYKCKNNVYRNLKQDFFVEATDNPIPDKCPRLTYTGPAEQTAGYKCPVCGEYTNPYHVKDNLCGGCGYKLNIG